MNLCNSAQKNTYANHPRNNNMDYTDKSQLKPKNIIMNYTEKILIEQEREASKTYRSDWGTGTIHNSAQNSTN